MGIDGKNPLFLFAHRNLVAVSARVSRTEFCGPEAEERLCDLSWIGPRAFRHDQIIQTVMRRSPVLPIPFATLFESLERLESRLKKHHEAVSAFLDHMEDKEEWGIKVYWSRDKTRTHFLHEAFEHHRDSFSSAPGHRYLQERRIHKEVEGHLNSWFHETVEKCLNDLRSTADAFCVRNPGTKGAPGIEGEVACNWAFLLLRSEVRHFTETLARLNGKVGPYGLIFQLTGPWPPYSFCPQLQTQGNRNT